MGFQSKWLFLSIGFLLLSCTAGEQDSSSDVLLFTNSIDIDYGSDLCSFTQEPIETVRYGGKITLSDGETHKFMSAECVAGFILSMKDKARIQKIEIVDFAHGQQYLEPDDLVFLRSQLRPSPNGLFLTAIDRSNTRMKSYIYDAYPGTYMEWKEVLELVRTEWDLHSE